MLPFSNFILKGFKCRVDFSGYVTFLVNSTVFSAWTEDRWTGKEEPTGCSLLMSKSVLGKQLLFLYKMCCCS